MSFHVTLTSSQSLRFGCKFHLRSLSCVYNQSTSPLFYFFLLHRADETQSGRNNCARLQFLAFSLDCIMQLLGGAVASWLSALVLGSSGPGSSPGRGYCVVFLGKTLYSHRASLQEYKWVPANCWGKPNKLLGSYLRWTSIPSRGSRNTPSRFMLRKPG